MRSVPLPEECTASKCTNKVVRSDGWRCGGVLFGTKDHAGGCGFFFCDKHLVGHFGPFYCEKCWSKRERS